MCVCWDSLYLLSSPLYVCVLRGLLCILRGYFVCVGKPIGLGNLLSVCVLGGLLCYVCCWACLYLRPVCVYVGGSVCVYVSLGPICVLGVYWGLLGL